MLTQSKPKAQVSAPQFQHPSITPEVMAILRDYEIAAAVLSWDNFTYDTPCQITPGDITNIGFNRDIVCYQIGYHRSIPIDIETFQSHWSQIKQLEAKEIEADCPRQLIQPAGMAGDSVSSQLQPKEDAIAEYESGFAHGRLDAANGLHLCCKEASCPYSQGYLNGYNSFRQPKPQPEAKQQKGWRVTWNPKWEWYEVWVGDRWVGRASDNQEAERIAQKYIAAEQLRQQHRDLVLASYAPMTKS